MIYKCVIHNTADCVVKMFVYGVRDQLDVLSEKRFNTKNRWR